jgi:hypothetical protein
MSKTRNNHYVPQWYQEGFFELGRNTLAYLDLSPPRKVLSDGRIITERATFEAPTSRAFRQVDLYSTFFGTSINDEIERRLFGDIDARGSQAVRAFTGTDAGEWHRHFQTLFEYIDIQKIRTPKGLDWLKAQYPQLTQNELMFEMQGVRMMHCTIWTEGVREIVSAEDADIKFIISDHPVTIYNHALPPDTSTCAYPCDPGIALKASQTIFPLTQEFCLILTNLEYARDPSTSPLEKRTFPRNYRSSMTRTDAFIRTRKLSRQDVARINYILKARARRYIAAGRKAWLYPEETVVDPWADLRQTLLPPKDGLWHFGGEMFTRYEDGRVRYQDEFGRTEKQRDYLVKAPRSEPLRSKEYCGCGSGRSYEDCCKARPAALRPTWDEYSIRERNLMLFNGIANVLDLDQKYDWVKVRRNVTDEKIAKIYSIYQSLWPLETDLLKMLPKPDGIARSVYTGCIHPSAITEFALASSLYFGELIIEHPFVHPGIVRPKYNPIQNPHTYRAEFLKTVYFFLNVIPLVELGLVNLVPNPGDFDSHIRDQALHMARFRASTMRIDASKEVRLKMLAEEDCKRSMMTLPKSAIRSILSKSSPEMDEKGWEETFEGIELLKERDPLAVLQENAFADGEKNAQFTSMKIAPHFEIAMYLAQATGACIVTDSLFRWEEIKRTIYKNTGSQNGNLHKLARSITESVFAFPQDVRNIAELAIHGAFADHHALIRDSFKYLLNIATRGSKPNFEDHLSARFGRAHSLVQSAIKKAGISAKSARISCAFPTGGIQDNTVNRLLLMSRSENHLSSVPMGFFIEPDLTVGRQ